MLCLMCLCLVHAIICLEAAAAYLCICAMRTIIIVLYLCLCCRLDDAHSSFHCCMEPTPNISLLAASQRIKEERNMLWLLTGYLPFVSNSHLPAKQPKLHGRRFLGDMMAVRQRKEEIRTRFHIKYLGLFLFKQGVYNEPFYH